MSCMCTDYPGTCRAPGRIVFPYAFKAGGLPTPPTALAAWAAVRVSARCAGNFSRSSPANVEDAGEEGGGYEQPGRVPVEGQVGAKSLVMAEFFQNMNTYRQP
jgi:hypothetical protein